MSWRLIHVSLLRAVIPVTVPAVVCARAASPVAMQGTLAGLEEQE